MAVCRAGYEASVIEQLSARGGTLRVRMVGDRVHVFGQAVTVFRGDLEL